MTDDMPPPFSFPAVARKKIAAAFDGGRISSDGGVMLLAAAERRLHLADRLAAVIPDPRDPGRITHRLADILRARIFAIACGYEDANDLDRLRADPVLTLACGRLPGTGRDLCSQPTCSRIENLPDLRTVIRLVKAFRSKGLLLGGPVASEPKLHFNSTGGGLALAAGWYDDLAGLRARISAPFGCTPEEFLHGTTFLCQ